VNTYDGLYQVKTLDRGTLNGSKTGIISTPSWEEDWNYDPTGNWRGTSTAYLTKVNGSTTLNQNRAHNLANEITNMTWTTGADWSTPTHGAECLGKCESPGAFEALSGCATAIYLATKASLATGLPGCD
jgi:hypothetical protein